MASRKDKRNGAGNGVDHTPSLLGRADFHFRGGVGRAYLDSDLARIPQVVKAPKRAPNILLILLDDAGTFGGGIASPTMERLAKEGLRYNRFQAKALCSPTRAELITGRLHHAASFAAVTEPAMGSDDYCCPLPRECGTIGEVLGQSGYMTAWIGQNHSLRNIADQAISWVRRVKSIAPGKPFFLHVAAGATQVAGSGAHADREMGRVVDAVKALPDADNTIILYVAGDNGGSAEARLDGSVPSQTASHFDGTRNPMIISWPARIKDKGAVRSQFVHAIDVAPTLYELCGIAPPDILNGVRQTAIEGVSFAYSLGAPKDVSPLLIGEERDTGMDSRAPADFSFELPFAFAGKIAKATAELRRDKVRAQHATAAE